MQYIRNKSSSKKEVWEKNFRFNSLYSAPALPLQWREYLPLTLPSLKSRVTAKFGYFWYVGGFPQEFHIHICLGENILRIHQSFATKYATFPSISKHFTHFSRIFQGRGGAVHEECAESTLWWSVASIEEAKRNYYLFQNGSFWRDFCIFWFYLFFRVYFVIVIFREVLIGKSLFEKPKWMFDPHLNLKSNNIIL